MVEALWYGASGWLDRLRLLRGGFKGKGAVGRLESISGCGLARDHTPLSWAQTDFGCGHRPALGGSVALLKKSSNLGVLVGGDDE
jgi:hypothetical protein